MLDLGAPIVSFRPLRRPWCRPFHDAVAFAQKLVDPLVEFGRGFHTTELLSSQTCPPVAKSSRNRNLFLPG